MAIGDKVGYETVREMINYLQNTLGINKDMQKYIQSIIKTSSEIMDEQGKALFEKLEGALATVSTADKWLADPQVKSETIMLLERLNRLPDDPETRDMLNFTKEILRSVRDGLGRNDGEFMINLSGALETVADFKGIINVIREYLTPTSAMYFRIASPIAAKVLMHIISFYTKSSSSSSKENEDLNVLKTQLIVQFEIGRILAGLYLIGRQHIKLEIKNCRSIPANDPLQLQNTEILDQMERECMQYLECIAPLSPDLLKVIQGIQLRIEEEMKADKKLLKLTPAVLLDRINCFTHGDILLQGLYQNTLAINLVSTRSSLTWKYLSSIYEQNGKLAIVLHKFINEIKEGFSELFDIITKTQIDTAFSLWQALTVIYSDDECDYELYFPTFYRELFKARLFYHRAFKEAHVRDLLRAEEYTRLSEENGLYDLLINLLRKRAFFEVSHQLFCSLRFPNNISREVKIGALDVYNTVRHPIDTMMNMGYVLYLFVFHPIQTSRQIGKFFWYRPIRALTSTAINGAVIGGVTIGFSKFLTTTLELTPETCGMFYGNTSKIVATVASVVDSPFSTTVLAGTGAITIPTITSLLRLGNRRVRIARVFQDEDQRLLSMNAQTFFKTIDQAILDNPVAESRAAESVEKMDDSRNLNRSDSDTFAQK